MNYCNLLIYKTRLNLFLNKKANVKNDIEAFFNCLLKNKSHIESVINYYNILTYENKKIFLSKIIDINDNDLIYYIVNYFFAENISIDESTKDAFEELISKYMNIYSINNFYSYFINNINKFSFNLREKTVMYFFKSDKYVFMQIMFNLDVLNNKELFFKYQNYLNNHISGIIREFELDEVLKFIFKLTDQNLLDKSCLLEVKKKMLKFDSKKSVGVSYKTENLESIIKDRTNIMLNDNKEIYFWACKMLRNNQYYGAWRICLNARLDNERSYYFKILKMNLPIALILEKNPSIDRIWLLRLIENDKLKTCVYGEEILNGYKFDDREKNKQLDAKMYSLYKHKDLFSNEKYEETAKKVKKVLICNKKIPKIIA